MFPVSNAQIRSFVAIWEIGFWTWTIEYNLPLWSSPHFPRCSCVANKIRVSLENSSCKVCRVAVSLKHAEGIKSWLKPGLSKESCWPALCKMRYCIECVGCGLSTIQDINVVADIKRGVGGRKLHEKHGSELHKLKLKFENKTKNWNHSLKFQPFHDRNIPKPTYTNIVVQCLEHTYSCCLGRSQKKSERSCSNLMSTILPPNCFPWKKMNLALNDMYWFIVIVIPKTTQPVPSVLQYV